jgi:primary-amine oxidase
VTVSLLSFFLTPLNYFDYDVSVESTNAILLSAPDVPGGEYKYDDYGVSPVHCIPPPVSPFEYKGLKAFGTDGKPAPLKDTEELRKEAELYHRIKIEL